MITNENKEKFNKIKGNIYRANEYKGIGTYQEKMLHRVIKSYYEEDVTFQEIKVNGYVADIFKNNQIIEVQTRSFNKLVKKLDAFLNDYNVNIVYPIAHYKYISWIDEMTLEEKSIRKSPKVGNITDVILELYKIKQYLKNPNLKITLLFIDLKELRYLNGWSKDQKRGAERCNQIPLQLVDEIVLDDYSIFVPFKEIEFTSKDYAKKLRITIHRAQVILNILKYLEIIEVIRKEKRSNVYKYKK